MKDVNSIAEYISDFTIGERNEFRRIGALVRDVESKVVEKISYGIPCWYYNDKMLIGFMVTANYLSLYPGARAIEQYHDELANYELSKGTIRYQLGNIVPDELVKKIIASRKIQIDTML